ncbi:hypothetical protein PIB30_011497 [Stylosanthes scabra]|uniref:Uncharacterized protein n=1 Tax=Stylosanthes scabra TaxID=79078 RepID=A0ABU6S5F4_9FABA|nr:hypothetical protein [Stylosanthes scabra]
MSSTPTTDAPSQSQGNVGQGTATSAKPSGTRKNLAGKKRKHVDILEKMADKVHESTAAQKEHVQILANAIFGKNANMKMGEKLEQLRFTDHDVRIDGCCGHNIDIFHDICFKTSCHPFISQRP